MKKMASIWLLLLVCVGCSQVEEAKEEIEEECGCSCSCSGCGCKS